MMESAEKDWISVFHFWRKPAMLSLLTPKYTKPQRETRLTDKDAK